MNREDQPFAVPSRDMQGVGKGGECEGEQDGQRTEWLLRYEPWLRLLARLAIDSRFQSKFSSSDVVQQTLLEAWKGWPAFRGTTEAQRMAWLRQILAHQLARLARHYGGTQKRALHREVPLAQSLDETSRRLEGLLATPDDSPSRRMQREEQQTLLARVLDRLPDDYREVLVLRNLENLPHHEVALRMNRTEGAVRMLWVRALGRLREVYLELQGSAE
jgi:RNA polymerase sigma-70 factor, ECF subfamily